VFHGTRVNPDVSVAVQPREYVAGESVTRVQGEVLPHLFDFHDLHSFEFLRDLPGAVSTTIEDDEDGIASIE
jgi:hypothetical protein